MKSSRLEKFYQKSISERLSAVSRSTGIPKSCLTICKANDEALIQISSLSENVIGLYPLPLAILTNFIVNKKELLIPYACMESGVVAGACLAAKLCRATGGFTAKTSKQIVTGHIIITKVSSAEKTMQILRINQKKILKLASKIAKHIGKPFVKPLESYCKLFSTKRGKMIGLYVDFDVGNLTGPRTISTICSSMTKEIEKLIQGTAIMALHTDFAIKRIAFARAKWRASDLESKNVTGERVIERIIDLAEYAKHDVRRACTNNKGIMNGINALAVVTGNDAPLLEAGAHAYASRNGKYSSLSRYFKDKHGNLIGEIALPISMGVSGGVTHHPFASTAQKIMKIKSAKELAEITACVGLAQNLAALRALVTQNMESGNKKLASQTPKL